MTQPFKPIDSRHLPGLEPPQQRPPSSCLRGGAWRGRHDVVGRHLRCNPGLLARAADGKLRDVIEYVLARHGLRIRDDEDVARGLWRLRQGSQTASQVTATESCRRWYAAQISASRP